jgi:ATP-dependent RNA helicase DDX3X
MATETLAAQAAGVFDTGKMQAALPGNGTHDSEKKVEPPAGWIAATPYDYNAYGADGGHVWEGNARVYEFDGETGDVGPEFPALEIELFGEPGNRAKKGIDFSK